MLDVISDWHASGIMALTGRPDGPEMLPLGNAATVARELSAYLRSATEGTGNVIEASRPRALRRFGLHAEDFADAGGVWVSISARGRQSDRVGFGDDIAAASGLFALDEDGTPLFVGDAIADPLSGLAAAAAVLNTASGAGRLVEIAMSDVVSSTLRADIDCDAACVPASSGAAAPLRSRRPRGSAPASGENTGAVLREFELR
ncbi:CoA transferase [Nocardia sp. NPDC005366]|uniref:CoA transferase n=1 Tax=Nocardia sp. NPDC005366 TaxID=3156878 RepID=UPI0033B6692A